MDNMKLGLAGPHIDSGVDDTSIEDTINTYLHDDTDEKIANSPKLDASKLRLLKSPRT